MRICRALSCKWLMVTLCILINEVQRKINWSPKSYDLSTRLFSSGLYARERVVHNELKQTVKCNIKAVNGKNVTNTTQIT